jgi:membrane associated rhomboid family serine protease
MTEHDFDIEHLKWIPIPAELKQGLTQQRLPKRKLRSWELVLAARHIPYRLQQSDGHYQLFVPTDFFQRASDELAQYEHENRNWPPPPPTDRPFFENRASTLWVLIGLVIFHNIVTGQITALQNISFAWETLGSADAGKILTGEWWRLLTALTLHADALHLLGNITFGGLFMLKLCQLLGSGPAWLLVLLSGAGGNLINALVQAPTHRSIGASTAVFGAVGLLAMINLLHYRQSLWRRWLLPFAAAIGLLGILGTNGDNTDILAHLFGFLCGAILAFGTAHSLGKTLLRSSVVRACCSLLAIALLSTAWWFAIKG